MFKVPVCKVVGYFVNGDPRKVISLKRSGSGQMVMSFTQSMVISSEKANECVKYGWKYHNE
jgi:hypothetical protein